ncbi:T9SS type A sorting domain-containing protein [Flavobacterium antarcticum]|uniref:DUF7619 domain-containing protein n=1 Tax=Flavobacterium antarcticum TaxID=271155 RepID=UPI000426B5E3|nr:T9SS type A sorting domain-containing protein [Flavobacterium antarcticum]
MKTLVLFITLLLSALGYSQIINIPNAAFKSKLLAANSTNFFASTEAPVYSVFYNNWSGPTSNTIDTNGDGEIQVSEALAIKCLNLKDSNLTNLSGIEFFTNLQSLRVNGNNLTSLNLNQNTALINLRCENNLLTTLNIDQLTGLLDFNCEFNQLTSFSISQSTLLQRVYCNNNNLTTLNVSQLPNLEILQCTDNALTSLDLSQSISLKKVDCGINLLTSLNVSGASALESLACSINQLTTLDLSQNTLLKLLRCETNQLTSLNVSQCVNLEQLWCYNNQLETLDVSTLANMTKFVCNTNQLTSLDVSQCVSLNFFDFSINNLMYLNVKNGVTNWLNFYFDYNPNLQYVCVDDENKQLVENYTIVLPNCHINSYCTFSPGGNYFEIAGNVVLDFNNDGCDSQDPSYKNLNFTVTDGTNTLTTIANQTGSYYIPVGSEGTTTVTPHLENPSYFTIAPSSFDVTFPTVVSPFTQNFCVTANGIKPDVAVILVPITPARPGFDAMYSLQYRNKGNQVENGSVSFSYDQQLLEYVMSNPVFDNQTANSFTWNFTNLQPFETRNITFTLNVNGPMEIPPVHGGDLLSSVAVISTSNTDLTPTDNLFTLNQIVVGSYDPNDKTCLEGMSITPAMVGTYVHYMIRFENTGTYFAENIVVRDDIDSTKFDISSLIPVGSSHDFVTRIKDNRVEFIFEGVNLPFDDAQNDGYVVFKIKTKPNLVLGAGFSNSAGIYFDYNFPIETNNYTTTVQNYLSLPTNAGVKEVVVYPNPVTSILNFDSINPILKVEIYDISGKIRRSNSVHNNQINLFDLKSGSYILKLFAEQETTTAKIIKQ